MFNVSHLLEYYSIYNLSIPECRSIITSSTFNHKDDGGIFLWALGGVKRAMKIYLSKIQSCWYIIHGVYVGAMNESGKEPCIYWKKFYDIAPTSAEYYIEAAS